MLQPRLLRMPGTRPSLFLSCHLARAYATVQNASAGSGQAPTGQGSAVMRSYKPRTPGVRHLRRPINDHLWKGKPFKPLTIPKKGMSKGGRNCTGHITVRHRGGGHKRRLRTVDFHRWRPGPQLVERIEYDPGRSAHIALLTDRSTGLKSYVVAAEGMRAGDVVQSYRSGLPKDLIESMGGTIDPGMLAARTALRGNCLPMHLIPVGTVVYNVGSQPKGPAVFCRSAGTYAIVMSKEEESKQDEVTKKTVLGRYVTVKLQSGEVRRVSKDACATVGVASNPFHKFRQLGKAGRSRRLGIRPTVRGVAMNRVDHPHGGGRGKSKSNRHPVSPWGKPAKSGKKTRKTTIQWVVTPRARNFGKRRSKSSS